MSNNGPIKERELKSVLSKLLFEYAGATQSRAMAPGLKVPTQPQTYDKMAGNIPHEKDGDAETTIPSELPLEPSDMMATQLASDRPPVEDEDFVPTNVEELGRASAVLASIVPQQNIEQFYEKLKDLVEDEVGDPLDDEMPMGAVGKLPVEAAAEEEEEFDSNRQLESLLREIYDEPASLETLAPVMGKSGPSGVRQELDRVMMRAKYWAENATMEEIERLKTVAVGTFIDGLLSSGYIDDDEAVDLQQDPVAVKDLPSFQFFFVNSMIVPAYRQLRKNANDAALEIIYTLNIPQRSVQSYLNMVMGDVPLSTRKLRLKIVKDAIAEGIDEVDAGRIALEAVNRYPDVAAAAKVGSDFVNTAIEKFHSMNPRKLGTLIQNSLASTQEFYTPQ